MKARESGHERKRVRLFVHGLRAVFDDVLAACCNASESATSAVLIDELVKSTPGHD